MVQLITIVAVVSFACSVFGSLSYVPEQDQYKTRGVEDEQQQQQQQYQLHQPQQLRFGKATDYQFPNVHLQHRFGPFFRKIIQTKQKTTESVVPELQVGCGEGFTERKDVIKKMKRRRKRGVSFYYTPPLRSYSIFKPQVYQIQKPYIIPVWGALGKIPIYFPPQPIMLNPGYPKDNPKGGYLPTKGYLPPDEPTKPNIADRFMDTDDDAPIWDTETVTQRPLSTTTQIIPTRRTRRPGQRTTIPPLVHNEVARNDTFINLAASPPLAAALPSKTLTTTTTPVPLSSPSRCVWAIVSCCTATSADISYACFEQLGCSGPFWDNSPCDSELARAAIDRAMQYYGSAR